MNCVSCCKQKQPSRRTENDSKEVRDVEGEVAKGYGVHSVPPWYHTALLTLQHLLVTVGTVVLVTSLLAPSLCIRDNYKAHGEIITTSLFVAGLTTLMQSFFGIRLPVIEGSSTMCLAPLLAFLSQDKWPCPDISQEFVRGSNGSSSDQSLMRDAWKIKMREIQGGLMVASLISLLVGVSGVMGLITRFLTPMTLCVLVTLNCLSQFTYVAQWCSTGWWTALMTCVPVLIFTLFVRKRVCNSKCPSIPVSVLSTFTLYSIVIAIMIGWVFAAVLTGSGAVVSNSTSHHYQGRVDARADLLKQVLSFKIPYPFQWGYPTCSLSAAFTMIVVTFTGSICSVGDYYACAHISEVANPPSYVINRGAVVHAVSTFLHSLLGTGRSHGVFTQSLGTIAITKVTSRRVVQMSGVILLVTGVFGKLGILLASVPTPVSGAISLMTLAYMSAVGMSYLQHVNLNSTRNICVMGVSIITGLFVSSWVIDNPRVRLGPSGVHELFSGLLSSATLIGGALCIILDNIVPDDAIHGTHKWMRTSSLPERPDIYDLPVCESLLQSWWWTRYIPFCSNFSKYYSKKRRDSDVGEQRTGTRVPRVPSTHSVLTTDTQI